MEIQFECDYCGHIWQNKYYNSYTTKNEQCPVCKDKYPKYKELSEAKVDYYKDSPPFEKKLKEKSEDEELNYFRFIE